MNCRNDDIILQADDTVQGNGAVTDIPRVFIPSQLSQTKLQFPFSFKESS
jgi:hypothetical protein